MAIFTSQFNQELSKGIDREKRVEQRGKDYTGVNRGKPIKKQRGKNYKGVGRGKCIEEQRGKDYTGVNRGKRIEKQRGKKKKGKINL